MGFNATRRYRGPARTDILILVFGVVVVGGLVLWGFLGF
jgi:hypothetical protein